MKSSTLGPLGSTYCLKDYQFSVSLSYYKGLACPSVQNLTIYYLPNQSPLGTAQRPTRVSRYKCQSYIPSFQLLAALAAERRHAFGSWHPTHQMDEIPVSWLHPSRTRRSHTRVAEDLASEHRCLVFPMLIFRWMNHSFSFTNYSACHFGPFTLFFTLLSADL